MTPILEEHDALIVAAARGILVRAARELHRNEQAERELLDYNRGRVAGAFATAAEDLTRALTAADHFGGCPHARAALERGIDPSILREVASA